MAKKALRGKRHIRSRWTVQVGRDRKRVKKFNQGMEGLYALMAHLRSQEFADEFAKATTNAVEAVRVMTETLIKRLGELNEQPVDARKD
jgi:hypothetical protein